MRARKNAELSSIYDRCGVMQRESTDLIISATFKTVNFNETTSRWFKRLLEVSAENDQLRAQLNDKAKLEGITVPLSGMFEI
jgi:hypothetical protein